MTRSRPTRILAWTLLALLPAGAAAALMADNEPRNLVIHGDFESTAINLRLPHVSPFPLVAGGWGARGAQGRDLVVLDSAPGGGRALQLTSRVSSPTHVIQDVALATDSFLLELRVRRMRGRQSVRVVGEWNRMDMNSADQALEVAIGNDGMRLATPAGAWSVDLPPDTSGWMQLRIVADARSELVQVWVDDTLAATVPGRVHGPRTLLIGGNAGSTSRFRYDRVTLFRLAEVELAEIRRLVLRAIDTRDLPWITERLDAAATALERGDEAVAEPEVRAASRLIIRSLQSRPQAADGELLHAAAADLAALLAAR